MEPIYIIDGLLTAFGSYEDANKFRKWYNRKFDEQFYIEPDRIKKLYCFCCSEDAQEWSTQPDGFYEV